jgi:hypothetical protein
MNLEGQSTSLDAEQSHCGRTDVSAGRLEMARMIYDSPGRRALIPVTIPLRPFCQFDIQCPGAMWSQREAAMHSQAISRAISGAAIAAVILLGLAAIARADTTAAIDRLIVIRAGKLLFEDAFTGKLPPPAAPAFANGQAAAYFINGTIKPGSMANGKLTLTAADGVFGQLPGGEGRRNLAVRLLTNTDPNNPGGLKAGVTFAVSGRFDLVLPDKPVAGYGIRLTDASPAGAAHIMQLFVRRDEKDRSTVRLQELNFATGLQNAIADVPIEAHAGQQILLTLARPKLTDSSVAASFQVIEKGAPAGRAVMVGTAPKLFDPNTWTRCEFFVFEAAETP